MHLSIAIVNWNTRELLSKCLESIYSYPPQCDYEVVVVDNASSDGSCEMVCENFPQVVLINNKENAGFARATNQAIQSGESTYVLLLNPDTVVLPDALQQLVEFMDTHPEAGAAGSRVLNPDGSLQTSCYVAPTLAHEFFRLFHLSRFRPASTYQMKNWNTNIPRLVDIIQGDCLMLRKTALNQVGLLDERFFIYSEDVDLCYRLQRASWGLYWVPRAQVIHYGGQSTRQVAAEMFLQLYQSKLMCMRKHHGKAAATTYKFLLLFAALPRLLLIPFSILVPTRRRSYHQNLGKNYRRLLGSLPDM
jgi:GT2 family glycosyltransferase